GQPILNPDAKYDKDPVSLTPGPAGAHNWSPMAFNPNTGLVYIPTSTLSNYTFAVDQNFTVKRGQKNLGVAIGAGAAAVPDLATGVEGTPVVRKAPSVPPAIGPDPRKDPRGVLVAWDPVARQERWHTPGGGGISGGTVTTAGNLVFQVI